jgi:hypothetical protein
LTSEGPSLKQLVITMLSFLCVLFGLSLLSLPQEKKGGRHRLSGPLPDFAFSLDLIFNFIKYTKSPYVEFYNYYVLARIGVLLFFGYFATWIY